MKIIEHRRHSKRSKESVHLSQKGVGIARSIGNTMGIFDKIITSGHERAFETAIAMGYAVDEQFEELMTFGNEIMNEVKNWSMSFEEIAKHYGNKGPLYQFCLQHEKWLRNIISKLPENNSLLIISHGGIVDYPLVHFFPDKEHIPWGSSFSYCEGYRLFVEDNKFVSFELLRV